MSMSETNNREDQLRTSTIDDIQEITKDITKKALESGNDNSSHDQSIGITADIDSQILSLTSNMKADDVFFAQLVFEGKTHKEAYKLAGHQDTKDKSAAESGSRLSKKPNVKRLIELYKKRAIVQTGVTTERVVQELAAIGFSDIADIFEFYKDNPNDPNCETKVRLRSPDQIDSRLIKSVSVSKQGNIKLQLYNKESCLHKIGEYLGMFNNERPQFKDKTYEEALQSAINNSKSTNLYGFKQSG